MSNVLLKKTTSNTDVQASSPWGCKLSIGVWAFGLEHMISSCCLCFSIPQGFGKKRPIWCKTAFSHPIPKPFPVTQKDAEAQRGTDTCLK